MAKGKSKRFATFILDEPLEIADPVTGELRKVARLIVPYGYKDKDFCKVYHKTINRLAELPKSCQKVFDYLLERMDFENKVYVPSLKELAKEVGLAYGTVKNAFSHLQKVGFIRKVNTALYMVNPSLACKVSDKRDLLVQFVNSEDFEQYIKEVGNAEA